MKGDKKSPALMEQERSNGTDGVIHGKNTKYKSKIYDFPPEIEKLLNLISDKKNYLTKLTNEYARKKVQSEILFLERDLLPILMRETVLLFGEYTNYFEKNMGKAVNAEADAMVMVIPLLDRTGDPIKIATVNPHRDNPIEGIEIGIEAHGREIEEVEL